MFPSLNDGNSLSHETLGALSVRKSHTTMNEVRFAAQITRLTCKETHGDSQKKRQYVRH